MSLLAAFFFTGAVLGTQSQQPRSPNSLRQWLVTKDVTTNQSAILTGTLDRPPEIARDRIYLVLRVEWISLKNENAPIKGLVSLLAPINSPADKLQFDALQLRFGARIRVKCRLTLMDQYRNPGVSSLSDYLDLSGLDSTGIIKDASAIDRLEDTRVFPPLAWLYLWRTTLQQRVDATFSPATAGVLDAAILGNRQGLSDSIADRFRTSGTFHVLVISGFHITFLGGLVFLLTARITRSRVSRFCLSSLAVWSYSLAVGAEASVVRAALMFTFVTFATVIFRQGTSLNALGAGALTAFTLQPKLLFDPSFQLTFLSVWAIVTVALPLIRTLTDIGEWTPGRKSPYPPGCSRGLKAFCELLFWREAKWRLELARSPHSYKLFKCRAATRLERLHLQRLLRYLFVTILVSLIVQVVLLPFFAVYFHRVSPASLILNFVVSFLLAVLSGVALLALIVAQLSAGLAAMLVQVTEFANALMVHSIDLFIRLGVASVRLPEHTGWKFFIYFLYYLPLLYIVRLIHRWDPMSLSRQQLSWSAHASTILLLLILVVIVNPQWLIRSDGRLQVDFLDVGQGDSALITMPDGTTILIDGGGLPGFLDSDEDQRKRRRIGETVVSEYLWWRGLSRIDYLVATHADADHIDGLNDVLKNFSVRSVLVARQPESDPEFAKLKATIETTGSTLETIRAGDTLQFNRAVAHVLWPTTSEGASQNNDSLVLRLQVGERTLLFTGDIEKETEQALLKSSTELKADVVKVAHHGSKSSSIEGFVRAAAPRLAIISVGRNSMFGHPHKEVVDKWQSIGAEVLTTGNCGMISIITDGHDLIVKKFIDPL
jgi:competence protein ComEC